MSWIRLSAYWGLQKPYNFRTAIPFLLSLFELVLLLGVGCVLFSVGNLDPGTQRFYFFLYVAGLLVVGALCSRIAVVSYVILCWCTIELCLALTSSVLEKYGTGASILPANEVSDPNIYDAYHPLLQHVLRPNAEILWHIGNRSKGADPNENWAKLENTDIKIHHNSLGLRGNELTPEDLRRNLIFIYGGSTTYDVSVTQGETWVEHVQAALGSSFTVLNFGVPGYSTTEHILQTAFYQGITTKMPVCAIYYVGWNDIVSVHIQNLDSAYADYHLLLSAKRRPDLFAAPYSPLVHLFNEVAKLRFDSVPRWSTPRESPPEAGSDPRLEAIFADHIRTLAAINHAKGIKVVFIAQMLNPYSKMDERTYAPFLGKGEFWPLQARFNSILKETALANSAQYIDPGVEHFVNDDFIDMGHFVAAGSRKFAALVAPEIAKDCQQ